ncbi:hypothetical protein BDV28DRAFT_126672 [Aspergillus coremiiformis]|uniref:Secreted protein n=1 Tax=Aspergillus coremiiformis TaxID=138285 RepID=A0A5N6ZG47_9EURO|nr:hypothetical protein BDV28DRAFT_126672 [Aspergillus coremiiformis]
MPPWFTEWLEVFFSLLALASERRLDFLTTISAVSKGTTIDDDLRIFDCIAVSFILTPTPIPLTASRSVVRSSSDCKIIACPCTTWLLPFIVIGQFGLRCKHRDDSCPPH